MLLEGEIGQLGNRTERPVPRLEPALPIDAAVRPRIRSGCSISARDYLAALAGRDARRGEIPGGARSRVADLRETALELAESQQGLRAVRAGLAFE